jgi:hypothetical protein
MSEVEDRLPVHDKSRLVGRIPQQALFSIPEQPTMPARNTAAAGGIINESAFAKATAWQRDRELAVLHPRNPQ